jgi:xylan 1,4-beta-xylosidase
VPEQGAMPGDAKTHFGETITEVVPTMQFGIRRQPRLAKRSGVSGWTARRVLVDAQRWHIARTHQSATTERITELPPSGPRQGVTRDFRPMNVPASYTNPVVPGFFPDPSICRVGADYYLATSSFEYFPGVPLLHSTDLVHFELIGHALTQASQLPLEGAESSRGIFAPTLRHHDGRFYLVTTNVTHGGNFYVTSGDPRGPWSEPIWLADREGVDPSLFFDDDGTVYYTRQGGGERGGIYQTELDIESGRLLGAPRLVWSGTGGTWPEGPHLYKRKGLYYLFIAEGGTGYDHMVTVARSRSPWGPFESCPRNPVLTHRTRRGHPIQATGHGDWVQTSDGHDFFVFLGIRPPDGKNHHLGRETFLAKLEWTDDGWPVIGNNGTVELEMPAIGLPDGAPFATAPLRDDFELDVLAPCWNFVRNPNPASFTLSERPGFLRLHGQRASLADIGSPAFVGRRQQHFVCRASARCEFHPVNEGAEAGLTLRANETNHYDLVIAVVDGQRSARLRLRTLGMTTFGASCPLPDDAIELHVRATAERYEFLVNAPGHAEQSLGSAATVPLASESAHTFTGVYIGMFAWASADAIRTPADFDWFDYVPG